MIKSILRPGALAALFVLGAAALAGEARADSGHPGRCGVPPYREYSCKDYNKVVDLIDQFKERLEDARKKVPRNKCRIEWLRVKLESLRQEKERLDQLPCARPIE